MSDFRLIFYLQDFNKPEREEFYSEDFRKAVHNEVCKRGENNMNRRKKDSSISKYKGLCWDKKNKKWRVDIAFNKKKGTVRGFHYQVPPKEGVKLIRCTRGRIWDVTLDLRPKSKTFKQWVAIELSSENYKLNYIPEGCAHAYQTLEDNSEVFYVMSQEYDLECERGVRYSDPAFNIPFPLEVTEISQKDASWESFKL